MTTFSVHFKEEVESSIVYRENATYIFPRFGLYDAIAHHCRPRQEAGLLFTQGTWKEHFTAGELPGLFLRVDVAELKKGCLTTLESIFLEEEGDEEPVEFQKDVVGFAVFEHIVGE